jgi:uncharacterized protein
MAVIIFKATEKCNANCIYCGVVKKANQDVMDYDLLTDIFKKINTFLLKNPKDKVAFTWHGGEVAMLGADYFEKAYEITQTECPETWKRIEHLVQSNMTALTQELLDAWKKLGISQIGTSFEPIDGIRGLGKNRDSKLYNKRFFQGVNLAEKNGFKWGFIYVVNKKSLENPLDTFHFLTNMNLKSSPMMNKMYDYGDDQTGLVINQDEYADFLGAIFPYWWKNRKRFSSVKPFSMFYDSIINGKIQMGCEYMGHCTNKWVYIGPTGETAQCGRAGDFGIMKYPNIKEFTLEEILFHKNRQPIDDRQINLPNTECKDCRFWGICHGGCVLDAYMATGDYSHKSPNCGWMQKFIIKYFEPITGVKVNMPHPGSKKNEPEINRQKTDNKK